MNPETRSCQNCKNDFIIEPEDFSFYEKIKVPPPTFCPECRMIRRLLFRNERTWYRRKCDATGKAILSMYAPDKIYKVYAEDYWKSDAWEPLEYAKDYDFSKNFFEQFRILFEEIPHPNMIQKNNVNSEYTNHTLNLKNCYFCVSTDTAENGMYLFNGIIRTKNCMDMHLSNDCEFCYELIDSSKSKVPQIIENMRTSGEYGEFFPPGLSPFSYNETIAQDYFTSDKDSVLRKGFIWKDPEEVY